MFLYQEEVYNTKAAQEIVPFLNELFQPSSVLDVGCGRGTWLSVFSEFSNVKRVAGVDGEYLDRTKLLIPAESFFPVDLNNPFNLNQQYDLLLSLEVAEHLKEDAAESFVESLTRHAKVIVFSAAIPRQGGQNHINEQWPEYWRKKFSKYGYYAYDIVRKRFWENEKVDWWYKQNMFIYIEKGFLTNKLGVAEITLNSYVHPALFEGRVLDLIHLQNRLGSPGIRDSITRLTQAVKRKMSRTNNSGS